MPTYCFFCPECKINFDDLCSWEEREKVTCPKCKQIPKQLMTVPRAIMFTNPKGTSKEDNFDYVAQTNHANAQSLRRAAEEANKHNHGYEEINDMQFEGKIGDVDPFLQGQ